jgi:hypothetical protein
MDPDCVLHAGRGPAALGWTASRTYSLNAEPRRVRSLPVEDERFPGRAWGGLRPGATRRIKSSEAGRGRRTGATSTRIPARGRARSPA